MQAGLFALMATLVAASPAVQDMVIKSALKAVPQGWELHSEPSAGHTINMHIGLKEENLDKLHNRLMEISHPDHPDYGKHMSKEEIDALTAPTHATVSAVEAWLKSHDVKAGPVSNGFMALTVTLDQAEKMLDTKYGVYHNAEKNKYTLRTTEYKLPKHLHDAITVVQPTTMFSDMGMFRDNVKATVKPLDNESALQTRAGCGFGVNPSCLRSLYNLGNYNPNSGKTSIGITGYLGERANQQDLSQFLSQYTNFPSSARDQILLVNGGSNSGSGTIEANLDTQYAMGLTYPVKNVFWETAGEPPFNPDQGTPSNTNEPYLDWLNYVLNQSSIPQTITSSYGDNEQTVPRDYADSVCNQFMKLGARGVSFLSSSGDGGVSGGQPSQCESNDGSGKRKFLPTFPATCQYVTAVGGTSGSGPESAARLSSGGFSDYYSAPDYQANQTAAYVASIGSQYSGLYNPKGRGFPDIAAQAYNFAIIQNGGQNSVAGTSCSAPTVAGIIANLNDYLASQNKPPLGFLNPFLYSKGYAGLNDITSGSNPGCNTNGFSAKKGWDPVTGLGSPDFGKLKNLV